MKQVTITDKLRKNPQLYSLVQRNMEILEDAVARSAAQVSAVWDLVEDQRGRPRVSLTLRDSTEEGSTSYTPAQLDDTLHMRFTLNRLWGDLLEKRSHKLLEEFQKAD